MLGLAALATLLSVPSAGWARGMGHDYFLVSPEGKLIRQLGTCYFRETPMDWVDDARELVYRFDGEKLHGISFAGKHLWSYAPPSALNWHTNLDSRSGVLAISRYDADWRVGLEPKTGKQLYRVPKEDAVAPVGSYRPLEESSGSPAFRYFLGGQEKPHELKKLDLRTGKLVWNKQLPAKTGNLGDLQSVTHGVIRFEKGLYCFDPETGAELTEIPTDPKSTRQIFFHADGVFHLSTGPSATLTVYEPGAWKRSWSVKDLTGVTEMVGPYLHRRLLCKADNALFVIDTTQQKLLAKISPPQFKGEGCSCFQTEKHVLVLSQGRERAKDQLLCFALPEGKLLWSRETGAGRAESIAIRGDLVLMADLKNALPKRGAVVPPVVAASLEEGKERWSWQPPQLEKQFADSVYLRLEACPSGFIVTRTWIVLD
jgi:outer membrane protein assembly factor BamB